MILLFKHFLRKSAQKGAARPIFEYIFGYFCAFFSKKC